MPTDIAPSVTTHRARRPLTVRASAAHSTYRRVMRWFLRLLGLVIALGLAASAALSVPLENHDGITPIHCTRIDSLIMGVGLFLLFWIPIAVVVERIAIAGFGITQPRDARLPRARVVQRVAR